MPCIFIKDMIDDEEQMPRENYWLVWYRGNVTYLATPKTVLNMLPDDIEPYEPIEIWTKIDDEDI